MIEVPGSDPARRDGAEGAAGEIDAALAAQTAMYTGPISLPDVNAERGLRPDPASVHDEVPPPREEPREPTPPPAPVLPVPVPEVVASDAVAAAAEPADPGADDFSRTVEQTAATSTLEAILMLENELRRRHGLQQEAPDAAAPPAATAPAAPAPTAPAPPAPAPPEPAAAAFAGETPTDGEEAWLTAPPPSFTPPALVEPPPVAGLEGAGPLEGDALPAAVASTGAVLSDFSLAPPPSVPAVASVPPPGLEMDVEAEGIDEVDRAGAALPGAAPIASAAPPPPSTATVVAVGDPRTLRRTDPSAIAVESSGAEPTPVERRAGHAARLFWLWFAANSSIILVAVGAILFSYGMSLRQVLIAVVAGVGLSALPLGLGSLAGKWNGQPTMVVSRASFGHAGNVLPAALAVLGRVLWGGVLLWLLAATADAMFAPTASASPTALIALGAGAVLAAAVAILGYGMLHRVQRVLGILSILLVGATIAFTADRIDIAVALRTDDGPWLLVVGGAVMVFSVVGLAWAQSSSDLARYQNPDGSGAASMLWGSFGVIVPALAILAWGALLAASDPATAAGLATAPLATLVGLVPDALALPVFAAAAFGLIAGGIVTMYSGGLAIVAVGVRMPRAAATAIAAVLVAAVALGLLLLDGDMREIVSELATTLAVPVAAWTGIFASEMMIRLRRFHSSSLVRPGGVYPRVRWVNLVGLVVISAIGFGLTSAQMAGLSWQGYVFDALGVAPGGSLATSDLGVLVALALGVLLPLVAGVPAIRRQERSPEAVEAAVEAPRPS